MQTLNRSLNPIQVTGPIYGRREDFIVDMISSKYRCLDAWPEIVAYLKGVIAAPEGAKTFLLEGLKLILTLALIMATGVFLLMVG